MIACPWKSVDLDMVFDPDAGNYADKAGVFAATHRPLPGDRQIAEAPPERVEDACRDAYDAVSQDPGHQWPVVVPVLGEPGTGKSHLVRWVWNEFARIPEESLAVVYVPRARLNIGGVMESLLSAAMEDPDQEVRNTAEELVAAARATSQERDPDRVARELRAEVVYQLKGAGARRSQASVGDSISPAKLENMLNALEAILTEGQEFEAHLHSDASAIGRRVAVLIAGRSEDALHEAPAGFTVEELQGYSQLVPGQTRAFQQAVQRLLVKEEWGSVELAASILNDALDRAVSELIAKGTRSGGLTFTEVFRKLRESLYRSDRELVLFIEELKLLGGLERELLEAFLDNRAAVGLEPICRIRALIACTTGEWRRLAQDIGTLTSRLDAWRAPKYSLDVSSGSEREDVETRLSDMAAHYLNAARVGVSELEESFRTAPDTTQWAVPNACSACAFRKRCHATFGSVDSGSGRIGLFPFTERALVRSQEAAQQQQLHSVLEEGFNPRVLLTGVLAPVLKHISLDAESFPTAPLARELGYLPASEASIRQALVTAGLDDEEAARAAVLVEAWGSSSVTPDGSLVEWSLDTRIAEGFGVSTPPTVATRPAAVISPRKKALRDDEAESSGGLPEAIERWRNGGPLDSAPRRNLRNHVNALIMRRVDWNSLVGVSPRLNDPRSDEVLRETGLEDPERFLLFEEAGDAPSPPAALTFSFARSDDDYGFLAAAVEAATGGGRLQADELVTLAEGLAERAQAVEAWVRDRAIGFGGQLESDSPGLAALAITTLAHGLDPGTTDVVDAAAVLNGMIAEAENFPTAGSSAAETRELATVVNSGVRVPRDDIILRGLTDNIVRADVRRWLLRRIGLRLSATPAEREQPQMIDAGAIYASVTQISERASLGEFSVRTANSSAGESAAMAQLAKVTLEKLQAALRAEAERSRHVIAEVAPLLGLKPNASAEQFCEGMSAAVSSAESAAALVLAEGKVPTGDLPGNFHKRLAAFSELRSKVSEPEVLGALLALARSSPRSVTRPTAARFLRSFGRALLYREFAHVALITAGTYLEYLPDYVRSRYQTTSDPVLAAFDAQYQGGLGAIATLVERVSALGTEKVEA